MNNFGCFYSNMQPRSYTVYTQENSGDALAAFDGGVPVGRNLTACDEIVGYATKKTSNVPTNLANKLTVNFPAPRNIENIFVMGERGKTLTVTLNGIISA